VGPWKSPRRASGVNFRDHHGLSQHEDERDSRQIGRDPSSFSSSQFTRARSSLPFSTSIRTKVSKIKTSSNAFRARQAIYGRPPRTDSFVTAMQSFIGLVQLTESPKAWSSTSNRTTRAAYGQRPTITSTIFRALASKPFPSLRAHSSPSATSRLNRLAAHPLPQQGRSYDRPTANTPLGWTISPFFDPQQIASHPELSQLHNVFVDNDSTLWLGCGQRLCHTNGSQIQVLGEQQGIAPEQWRIVFATVTVVSNDEAPLLR